MKSMLRSYDEKFTVGLGEVRSAIRELKGAIQTGPSHSMQGSPELDADVKAEPRAVTLQLMAEVEETLCFSPGDTIGNGVLDLYSAARRMQALENKEEYEELPGIPV